MTTSSDNKTPTVPRPEAKNWQALSCQFAAADTEKFGHWIEAQLILLERAQERFVTNRSLVKSLRRAA